MSVQMFCSLPAQSVSTCVSGTDSIAFLASSGRLLDACIIMYMTPNTCRVLLALWPHLYFSLHSSLSDHCESLAHCTVKAGKWHWFEQEVSSSPWH